ncbi:MAG: hypothetical protein GTO41_08095, partial [Burkholderiales bacterium]|nr:hypothetical protein [Burkholderiales bacterium]NIT02684.1 hypothetical protein [Candidatus Latescibacterota bacterium]
RVPREFRVIALRGLYTTPRGGFSWVPRDKQGRARLEDFEPALEALMTLIAAYPDLPSGGMDSVHVMGFSQGAALAYVAALRQPHRLRSVAGLAGFLPAGSDTLAEKPELRGLPFFIAHGTRDTTVPIAAAYHAVNFFRNLEAAVTFCEANTGHKLDADCARALAHFYRDLKGKQGE